MGAGPGGGGERVQPSYLANLVTVVLSGWFVVGLFLDAWAHNNLPGLESFFTPWHAVFYSGFVATALWVLLIVKRNVSSGLRGAAAVPTGYGLAVVALPVFALAGSLDYTWHKFLGIEQDLKILFSPTHLLLVAAMFAIVTSPLRAAWADAGMPAAPSFGRLLPAVLSLTFGSTLVLLFLQYGNAFSHSSGAIVGAFSGYVDPEAGEWALTSVRLSTDLVVTNLVLLTPLLVVARRWRLPFGTATVLFAGAAALSGAILGFDNPTTVAGVLVAGVCADLLVLALRPSADRRGAYWAFAALVPLVTWGLYLGLASIVVGGLPGIVEYTTGAPVVQAMLGLLLGVVLLPKATAVDSPPS